MHSPLMSGLAGVAIGLAVLVMILLAAGRALRPVAARKTLANHPGMADPVRYTFDPDHFEVHSTYTQSRYPWSQLWDWHETGRVIIVKPSPANFYVIPKREAEPAVLDRLRGYLAAARRRAR